MVLKLGVAARMNDGWGEIEKTQLKPGGAVTADERFSYRTTDGNEIILPRSYQNYAISLNEMKFLGELPSARVM